MAQPKLLTFDQKGYCEVMLDRTSSLVSLWVSNDKDLFMSSSLGSQIASQANPNLNSTLRSFANQHKVLITGTHIPQAIIKEVQLQLSIDVSDTFLIEDTETKKDIESLQTLWRFFDEKELTSSSHVIALGGGVITDMVGFAASCYLRGINFWFIPTTILSMVDAAIGGKNGINFNHGKNRIGNINQPNGVIVYPPFAMSLESRQISAGLCEILKIALCLDVDFFEQIEKWLINLSADKGFEVSDLLKSDELTSIIQKSIALKMGIVAQDEKDAHIRKVLNFGHTMGHALESASNFNVLEHGEAVGLGMLYALRLSQALGVLEHEAIVGRLHVLLTLIKCPTQLPHEFKTIDNRQILNALKFDKKRSPHWQMGQAKVVNEWIFLKNIGQTQLIAHDDMSLCEAILETLR